MQALISLIVTLSLVSGAQLKLLPYAYLASPFPVYHQYQNTRTGEHAYSYAGGPSAKEEIKDADGVTRGSYSYVDANGILQSVFYVADEQGFRVAATDLPTDGNLNLESHVILARSTDSAPSRTKRSAENATEIPAQVSQAQKNEGSASGVRTIYEKPDAPVIESLPSIATTHQSQVELVNRGPEYETELLAAGIPLAASRQSQVQIHKNARVQLPVGELAVQNVLRSPSVLPLLTPLPSYHENRIELHKQLGIEGLKLKDAVKIDSEPVAVVQSPGPSISLVPILSKESVPILSNVIAKEALLPTASLGSTSVTTSISSHGISQTHPTKILQEALAIPSVLAKEAVPVAVEKKTLLTPVVAKEAVPVVPVIKEAVPASLGTATSTASIISYGVSQIHGDSNVKIEPTLLLKAAPIGHLQPLVHYPLYLH
ncbi:uncharacterized protein LOC128874807 [Hylaeus volcanicus]|uniref:uncharacterized protein LOC128874807 n=1 Tax=Hylaeus volcanicus TaxID=313075 RepID=UPI0023B867B4|nr:uncharacterized protein LOC128874807 [Hylaeus volcanicus]